MKKLQKSGAFIVGGGSAKCTNNKYYISYEDKLSILSIRVILLFYYHSVGISDVT